MSFWDNVEGLAVQVAATEDLRDLRDNMALGPERATAGVPV
jgi:hypothetical protein